MLPLLTIVIVLACVVLGFFILVQAPKGGGLTGNFGSLSTQMMGVKQSTDVMEKGTWTTIGLIVVFCIASLMFIDKQERVSDKAPAKQSAPAKQTAPAQGAAAPAPGAPAK